MHTVQVTKKVHKTAYNAESVRFIKYACLESAKHGYLIFDHVKKQKHKFIISRLEYNVKAYAQKSVNRYKVHQTKTA